MSVQPSQLPAQNSNPAAAFNVLDVQRAFDSRPDHRQAEHVRILFGDGERVSEVRASVTWEALAQVRSELSRAGQTMADDDILGLVLVPWAMDQVATRQAPFAEDTEELLLQFGDSPRPPAVRETLLHYGLL
jgi:hypothetical protein